MSRQAVLAAGTFLLASTIAASAGGIGFGITIGPGAFGPGLHSAPPPREYRPRARSYHEEARPRRQQRQNSDDDAKAAETAPPTKSHANESSSIAVLTGKPDKADLHRENSSIAGASRPAWRAQNVADQVSSLPGDTPPPGKAAQCVACRGPRLLRAAMCLCSHGAPLVRPLQDG